jgi:hypothetical protein
LLDELAKSTAFSFTDRLSIAAALKDGGLITTAQHKVCCDLTMQHPKSEKPAPASGAAGDKSENKAEKRRKQLLSFADLYRTSAENPRATKRLVDLLESKSSKDEYEQKSSDQLKKISCRSPMNRFLVEHWRKDAELTEAESKELIRLAKLELLDTFVAELLMQRLVSEKKVPFEQGRRALGKIKSTIEDPSLLGIGDIVDYFIPDQKPKMSPAKPAHQKQQDSERKRPRDATPAKSRQPGSQGSGRAKTASASDIFGSDEDD